MDVHSYVFDADGKNEYGIPYPVESLTGNGSMEGHGIRCISAEWVVKFHTQYEPDENDFKDIHAVCATFSIPVPGIYGRRAKSDFPCMAARWMPCQLNMACLAFLGSNGVHAELHL